MFRGKTPRLANSPITWGVAGLLIGLASIAAGLFLRTDHGIAAVPIAPVQAATTANVVTVLIVALDDVVKVQEFSTMEKCSQAATYINIGTNRRATAQCVTK